MEASEATASRPAYSGSSVLNTTAGITTIYKLTGHWDAVVGAEYTLFGDSITDSPIIARDYQVVTYSAMVYRF